MTNLDTSKLFALKLSSLNDSDFDWVYSQLEQDIKDSLNPLLQEIRSIGLDVVASDVDDLIQKNIRHSQVESIVQKNISIINDSSFHEIVNLFKVEPAYLLKTLINFEDWAWKSDREYIISPKINSTKSICNIDSKILLKKSILSVVASSINDKSKEQTKKTEPLNFLDVGKLINSLMGIIKSSTKWKY